MSVDKIPVGKFWRTQPIRLCEGIPDGAIEPIGKEIRAIPYDLPTEFAWVSYDVNYPAQLDEIYHLLSEHYVADDKFRLTYSKDFLRWALCPPGYVPDLHLGVKCGSKLIGFISAVPVNICVKSEPIKIVEINFLCVRSDVRAHRLTPVLIMEITRRSNLMGIFQAVYTAGVEIPTPVARTQYFHRMLNPKKLIDSGFSCVGPRQTMSSIIRSHHLKPNPTGQWRPLRPADWVGASELLENYLEKFSLRMKFALDEFAYWFQPRDQIIYSYVVEDADKITDLCSFYAVPSVTLNNSIQINTAYAWYNVATSMSLGDLISDLLILAKNEGFDVFNCLDIHDNKSFLSDLKFEPGTGHLKYYLYNWATSEMKPEEVGIVLL